MIDIMISIKLVVCAVLCVIGLVFLIPGGLLIGAGVTLAEKWGVG